ncbi:hypothetical protein [Arsenophonus nasoniae]|uniref:Uncharacterized protein n=1 Tax=Arsenophonus nasoniae TaxID=638 RepID=A0AA95GDY9_9GAMM|nr:hypothetical protein [Arsenophonus nasoniae]WGL95109.1 hypothetical protein QE207_15815 [Arsenophonus nasoniae]
MIGDPKQAIKWPNDLVDFISRIKNENYTNILPINNVSRRIPKQILEQSNRFCYQDQYQTSSSIITGELQYLESNHPDYDNIINNFITKNQIVCIDKKQGRYLTNYINKYSFPYEIEELIKNSKHGRDANLILKAAYADFCYDASCNNKKNTITINNLIRRFSLRLNSRQYAQLYELYDYHNNQVNTSFRISSIDAVKGLEANICALILSPNLLKYFLVIDLKKNQFFNKEWKKIYVALTRPKKKMVLVIEHELLANYNLKEIKQKIKNFGFTCFKQNDADFT